MGWGIQCWQDAVEFILAGASAVAIGTALFVDPATPNRICEGLQQYVERLKVSRLSDLVVLRWNWRVGDQIRGKPLRPSKWDARPGLFQLPYVMVYPEN